MRKFFCTILLALAAVSASARVWTMENQVQRTDFSSGRSVVVNFSDRDYDYQGRTVKARDYLVL